MRTLRGHRLPYLVRVAAALSRSPGEAVERIHERIAERRERRAGPPVYEAEREWEAKLHALLGVEWPCAARAEFDPLWSDVRRLLTEQNLTLGRGAYGGGGEPDPALAPAGWGLAGPPRPTEGGGNGGRRGTPKRLLLQDAART